MCRYIGMVHIVMPKTDRSGFLRERILRRLLEPQPHRKRPRSLYEVAKEADVAYSWAYEVMKSLEALKAAQGSRVTKPGRAYGYWLKHHVPPLFRDYQVPDPAGTISEAGLPCAVTTYGADQVIQRYLFPRRYDVYVRGDDASAWHKRIMRRGFAGGGNMRLLLQDEDIIRTSERRHGLSVVCLPQLILDLVVEGGVCTEAARVLFRRVYNADPPVHWT